MIMLTAHRSPKRGAYPQGCGFDPQKVLGARPSIIQAMLEGQNVRCSVGLADQILAPCGALAESGVQNHPTLARVEIPTQYIFGTFLTAKRARS
jgi:hypothetical protein